MIHVESHSNNRHLAVHERIHTNVNLTCGKLFKRSDVLNVHERIHTNVNPYTCVTCGKSFRRSGELSVHKRIHTYVMHYTHDY